MIYIIVALFILYLIFKLLGVAFSIFFELLTWVGPVACIYIGWGCIRSTNHATLGLWLFCIGVVVLAYKVFN